MALIWVLAGAAALLFLVVATGLRNDWLVLNEWILALTPKGQRVYRDLEERVADELVLSEVPYQRAQELRQLGSVSEAIRLLDVGCDTIADFAPDMHRLLAGMAVFSRIVAAMAPVAPLRPAGFRLRQLASLAYLNQLAHRLLVTTAERFRLRVFLLGKGFAVVMRFLARSRHEVHVDPGSEAAWARAQAVREDFKALTEESLESFRVLLVSLAAERRE